LIGDGTFARLCSTTLLLLAECFESLLIRRLFHH